MIFKSESQLRLNLVNYYVDLSVLVESNPSIDNKNKKIPVKCSGFALKKSSISDSDIKNHIKKEMLNMGFTKNAVATFTAKVTAIYDEKIQKKLDGEIKIRLEKQRLTTI